MFELERDDISQGIVPLLRMTFSLLRRLRL